jgi:hypothetical protein
LVRRIFDIRNAIDGDTPARDLLSIIPELKIKVAVNTRLIDWIFRFRYLPPCYTLMQDGDPERDCVL